MNENRTLLSSFRPHPSSLLLGGAINELQFDNRPDTNRAYAPGDVVNNQLIANPQMNFDAAGNLIYDTYTGNGNRVYDAENPLISADNNDGTTQSVFTNDGDGKRVRRNAGRPPAPGPCPLSSEVWQVYGMDGELLAEYQSSAAAFITTKEYVYRGEQMRVTLSSGDDDR